MVYTVYHLAFALLKESETPNDIGDKVVAVLLFGPFF
jgi:hypothetical protein